MAFFSKGTVIRDSVLILFMMFFSLACKGEETTGQGGKTADKGRVVAMEKPEEMRHCSSCHSYNKGEKHKIGPNLFGVVGRKVGAVPGYPFTKEFKEGQWIWTRDNLDLFINKKRGTTDEAVKKLAGDPEAGTRMKFYGLEDDDARVILDYLETLKD